MEQSTNEYWKRQYRGKEISSHKSEISKLQKMKEKASHRIMRKTLNVSLALEVLKDEGNRLIEEVFEQASNIDGIPVGQSYFEFSSYDGSVVIRRNMNRMYIFDTVLKEKADEVISEYLDHGPWETGLIFMQEIKPYLEAFKSMDITKPSTSVRVLLSKLEKHASDDRVNHILMAIVASIISWEEDPYFRVYTKNDQGELELIHTSLSKI